MEVFAMFQGLTTAIVTPFHDDYSVDYKSLESLINWHINSGVNGILLIGSTGEGQTIEDSERYELIKFARKAIGERAKLMIGTGTSNTHKTLEYSLLAQELGADAVLVVAPFYNKPKQDGIIAHFKYLNDKLSIPIYIYNNPGRCAVDIADETVGELMKMQHIKGIKDSTGNPLRIVNLIKLRDKFNPEFEILCGDDVMAFIYGTFGIKGLVSVVGNVIPQEVSSMMQNIIDGDLVAARDAHMKYHNFFQKMFLESNPILLKYTLSKIGKCSNVLRLPLTSASENARNALDEEMKLLKIV